MQDFSKNRPTGSIEFKETENQQELTVSIRVPPETKKDDVRVVFKATYLKVSVLGHEQQPFVIDGTLMGAIDVDGAGWHMEGSGDDRKVVLDMEKTMGGITWHRLLK